MALGKNVSIKDTKDTLIKKTTSKGSNVSITNKVGQPSHTPGTVTYKTEKMTFYVKKDLLERLYNFAYWDRHTITEAFNIVLENGLKGENTKQRPQK